MKHQIAYLFPGQGSQAVGMGKSFYDHFPLARDIFQQANDVLGLNLTRVMFEGPEDVLKKTLYSQLAIYTNSMAIFQVFQQQFPHVQPLLCAGHSLGEYSALTAGGWLTLPTCLELVRYRAEVMQESCEKHPGTMAAVLGLDESAIKQLVAKVGTGLWAANFNCPGQVVISGTLAAMQQANELAKEFGARRVLPLQVHGAFHSGLMQDAEDKLAVRLKNTDFASSGVPIILNATGEKTHSIDIIRRNLTRQITSSVMWQQGMSHMGSCSLALEFGGKVLVGLNKKIGTAPTLSIETVEDLELIAKELA